MFFQLKEFHSSICTTGLVANVFGDSGLKTTSFVKCFFTTKNGGKYRRKHRWALSNTTKITFTIKFWWKVSTTLVISQNERRLHHEQFQIEIHMLFRYLHLKSTGEMEQIWFDIIDITIEFRSISFASIKVLDWIKIFTTEEYIARKKIERFQRSYVV